MSTSLDFRLRILGIAWVGIRTMDFDTMLHMFQTMMGLEVTHKEEENEFVVLRAADGDTVELFGPGSKYNPHFAMSKPVVGFLVDNIENASEELQSKGIEILGDIKRSKGGYAWQHFRGPDGNLYELTFDPARIRSR